MTSYCGARALARQNAKNIEREQQSGGKKLNASVQRRTAQCERFMILFLRRWSVMWICQFCCCWCCRCSWWLLKQVVYLRIVCMCVCACTGRTALFHRRRYSIGGHIGFHHIWLGCVPSAPSAHSQTHRERYNKRCFTISSFWRTTSAYLSILSTTSKDTAGRSIFHSVAQQFWNSISSYPLDRREVHNLMLLMVIYGKWLARRTGKIIRSKRLWFLSGQI